MVELLLLPLNIIENNQKFMYVLFRLKKKKEWVEFLSAGNNSHMRIKVQGLLIRAYFIEINQVFAKK